MEPQFRARAYKTVRKTSPHPNGEAGPFSEPVEGVEWAEQWLIEHGVARESFVDIYFNGESWIHMTVFYLRARDGYRPAYFGISNTSHAKWPVNYVEGDQSGTNLTGDLFDRTDDWQPGDSDEEEEGESEKEGSKPESAADTKSKGESEEFPDQDDEDDEEEEEDENAPEWDEDEGDENDENDGSDGDGDSETDKEEKEMPRVTLFAKMRGPKGWRKRAETDLERDRNFFGFRIGVLDTEEPKSSRAEYDTRVQVQFREFDSQRTHGTLRVHVPDGVEFTKHGMWWEAEVPYEDER